MSEGQVKESGPRVAGGDPGNETVVAGETQDSSAVLRDQVGSILEQAMWLRERGLSVIGIRPLIEDGDGELICTCADGAACGQLGKHPVIWKQFQTIRGGESLLRDWFGGEIPHGLGIVTGSISGLVDVETDPPDGEASWAALVAGRDVPQSWSFRSGGGSTHRLFALPDGVRIRTVSRIRPGLDTRGEGGIAVLPPTLHRTGVRYAWLEGCAPWECELAEAPDWLIEALPRHEKHGSSSAEALSIAKERTTRRVDEGAPDGERNVELYRYACRLRGKGVDWEEAWLLVSNFAAGCSPPLGDDEALKVLGSAWKRTPEDEKVDETFAGVGDLDPLRLDDFITGTGSRPRSRLWLLSGDFARLSRVRADRELVNQALRLGWDVDEILALVKAHRRKHGQDPTRGVSIAAIRGMAKEGDSADLSALGLLPFRVERLIQLGTHNATFILELDGGTEIELGDARTLEAATRFSAAIIPAGYVLSDAARRGFRDIVRALLTLHEIVADPGEEEELRQEILAELMERPQIVEDLQEVLGIMAADPGYRERHFGVTPRWAFVVSDGAVLVLPRELLRMVNLERAAKSAVDKSTLAAWLRRIGFRDAESASFTVDAGTEETPLRQRFWRTIRLTRPGWLDEETLALIRAGEDRAADR